MTSADREELVRLRRKLRVAKLENEILKRAAAYFAEEYLLSAANRIRPAAANRICPVTASGSRGVVDSQRRQTRPQI